MHNNMKADKSMWPILYCIMNLPPSLRHVVHVGMHMAGFDLGAYCSLDIFADELLQLWNVGFVVDGQRYKVFLIEILTDSRGREKLMKVQGAGSLAGCSKCDFEGIRFANTCVYNGWRRYLPEDDLRRNKSNAISRIKQVFYVCIFCIYNFLLLLLSFRSMPTTRGVPHHKIKTMIFTSPMEKRLYAIMVNLHVE